MARKLSEQEQLRALAEQQYASIRDREVFACWHVVVEAIANRWLWPEALDDLLHELDTGGGLGAEEYSIEVIDLDRVEVAFITERCTCPRDATAGRQAREEVRPCSLLGTIGLAARSRTLCGVPPRVLPPRIRYTSPTHYACSPTGPSSQSGWLAPASTR
jgi:hypothetical protein